MSGRQNYRIFCDDLPRERSGFSRDDSLQALDDNLAEALRERGHDIDQLGPKDRERFVVDVADGDTSFATAVEIAIETLEGK